MKNILILIIFSQLILYSCTMKEQDTITTSKNEILEVENNFAEMAKSEGIADAFLFYAAEDAVLMRNNKLVIGKNRLSEYFDKQAPPGTDVSLSWKPDFVDVSSSGDLGYTYGKYTFSYTDSTGSAVERSGVFHTVWKRQSDGTWKFVWD